MTDSRERMAARVIEVAKGAAPPPHRFADEPYGETAVIAWAARVIWRRHWGELAALGWSEVEIFGADPVKAWARIDLAGLCWLLGDGAIRSITAEAVVIENTRTGSRQTYRRRAGLSVSHFREV